MSTSSLWLWVCVYIDLTVCFSPYIILCYCVSVSSQQMNMTILAFQTPHTHCEWLNEHQSFYFFKDLFQISLSHYCFCPWLWYVSFVCACVCVNGVSLTFLLSRPKVPARTNWGVCLRVRERECVCVCVSKCTWGLQCPRWKMMRGRWRRGERVTGREVSLRSNTNASPHCFLLSEKLNHQSCEEQPLLCLMEVLNISSSPLFPSSALRSAETSYTFV